MTIPKPDQRLLIFLMVGVAVLVLVALVAQYSALTVTQVLAPQEQEALLGGYLNASGLPAGEHQLTFQVKTLSGEIVSAETTFVTP